MDFNCGTTIIDSCNIEYDWEDENTYKLFVNQVVDTGTLGIKLAVGLMAAQLSENLLKAMNALRCMLLALGNNTWTLIAAGYYAARQFNQGDLVATYLTLGAQTVCTCTGDVDGLLVMLAQYGMMPSEENLALLGSCSEGAAAITADAAAAAE